MSASPVARIEQLEEIEKDVISILQTAGATLLEIAKDRPAQKTVDNHTQKVMADIKSVEQNLSEQIKYLTQVSTGHPHEGSSYPSQKVLQTAWHRLEHAKSRISELDNHRNRLGADLPRTSSTVPKQGGLGSQQGSNNLKQGTSTNFQTNSSTPTTSGSTALKQDLNAK
jgi:mediator of RNA polymerase II transcription subunit 11